jgi:hypothetical protein
MDMQVVILEGVRRGSFFPLDAGQTLTVGRRLDNAVCLPDTTVARQHCEIGRDAAGVWLLALKSPSGTRLNGACVPPGERHPLRPGDLVQAGRSLLQLTALVRVERSWLGWKGGALLNLAEALDAAGAGAGLEALAGALEEAGCAERELLAYCRQPGTEACARWVVRQILVGLG